MTEPQEVKKLATSKVERKPSTETYSLVDDEWDLGPACSIEDETCEACQ
jgi:hypothetical protein